MQPSLRIEVLPRITQIKHERGAVAVSVLSSSWAMVVAPAATPRDIVDRLSSEAGKAIKSAEMQAKFVGMGVVGVGNTAAEAEAFLRAEVQKWGKVVREANVKIDQ